MQLGNIFYQFAATFTIDWHTNASLQRRSIDTMTLMRPLLSASGVALNNMCCIVCGCEKSQVFLYTYSLLSYAIIF